MLRVRSTLLKLTAAAAVLAGVAACDTPSGALGPRELRPTAPASRSVLDSLPKPRITTTTSTSSIDDTEYCRSGYQVAYREDGTPYCAPIE